MPFGIPEEYFHGGFGLPDTKEDMEKKLKPALSYNRTTEILRNAILAYEFELEQQGYKTSADVHSVLLNEFGMTEDDYESVMGREYSW